MLTAVTLSVVIQWLFGKCSKRNKVQSAPTEGPAEEEESEDFVIASEPEDATEDVTEGPIESQTIEEAVEGQRADVAPTTIQEEP